MDIVGWSLYGMQKTNFVVLTSSISCFAEAGDNNFVDIPTGTKV